jgi:hypothetical protein
VCSAGSPTMTTPGCVVDKLVRDEALAAGRGQGHFGPWGTTPVVPDPQPIDHPYLDTADTVVVHPGSPRLLTVLMLPGSTASVTCGLVPRFTIALQRAWYAPGLEKLSPLVRVGPVLVDPGQVRLPAVTALGERGAHPGRSAGLAGLTRSWPPPGCRTGRRVLRRLDRVDPSPRARAGSGTASRRPGRRRDQVQCAGTRGARGRSRPAGPTSPGGPRARPGCPAARAARRRSAGGGAADPRRGGAAWPPASRSPDRPRLPWAGHHPAQPTDADPGSPGGCGTWRCEDGTGSVARRAAESGTPATAVSAGCRWAPSLGGDVTATPRVDHAGDRRPARPRRYRRRPGTGRGLGHGEPTPPGCRPRRDGPLRRRRDPRRRASRPAGPRYRPLNMAPSPMRYVGAARPGHCARGRSAGRAAVIAGPARACALDDRRALRAVEPGHGGRLDTRWRRKRVHLTPGLG